MGEGEWNRRQCLDCQRVVQVMMGRFIAEVTLGLVAATLITVAVAAAMFAWGPWADPPGVDALFFVLSALALAFPAWRWIRRCERVTP